MLFVKERKCEFFVKQIACLGHLISSEEIQMAILKWPASTNLVKLQVFFELSRFYRKFVQDYNKIFVPMARQGKAFL